MRTTTRESERMAEYWRYRRERFTRRRRLAEAHGPLHPLRVRRRLVAGYLAALAAMHLVAIPLCAAVLRADDPAWGRWGVAWAVLVLVAMALWQLVVYAAGTLDGAPRECLDEYELSRLDRLRSRAYRVGVWFFMLFSGGALALGAWLALTRPDWAAGVPYLLGVIALLGGLSILAIPSVTLAWTTPED